VIALTGAALHSIDAALAVESDNRMGANLFALSAVGVDIIARAGLFDYSERIGHSNHRAQSNLHDPIASSDNPKGAFKGGWCGDLSPFDLVQVVLRPSPSSSPQY
jgi:hypothetical protein